jgi:hypothetical protein
MEAAVPEDLIVSLAPERLDEGAPEERACFGLLTICAGELSLTEGFDSWINGYRRGPLVSGYHAAEWFAWNWWRLRWEPESNSPTWWRAHKMVSIGEGYVWPNLTIFSDGLRTALISHPSSHPDAKPFRYVGANPRIVPSAKFESALDSFILQVLGRLRDAGIKETNLDRLWRDVLAERSDPDAALRRKFEALLGNDPDESSVETIEQLVHDASAPGKESMGEIAADHRQGSAVIDADTLHEMARAVGFDASQDVPRPAPETTPAVCADTPAWLLGAQAAQAFREQLRLGATPVSDTALSDLAGVPAPALARHAHGADLSFILNEGKNSYRMVLRSKWRTGRRFELARLLGDRIMNPVGDKLFPATRSHTFRQKAQRSFAAEFLSPFEEVTARLNGDYSEENRQDVAEHFEVSELTIRTLLVNHHRLERQDLDESLDISIA